ncbi:MAG TPA: c-type cytochrome [Terriglobales bacterium]
MAQRACCIVGGLLWAATLVFAQAPASDQSAGRTTFEAVCASCHGLNGKGGERAPDIATKPEIVRLSDNDTLKILRQGKAQSGMPGFGGLGEAKLTALLTYLRLLQGKQSSAVATGNVGDGKEYFNVKGGCAQCHMVQGVGGFAGPDLSDYGTSHSADDIRAAILSPEKRPGFRKALVKATTSEGHEISGLVRNEDNFSIQLQGLDGTFYLLDKSRLSHLTFETEPLMSSDYGSRLSGEELDQLVAYLASLANTSKARSAGNR